jgi:hypothetical protein
VVISTALQVLHNDLPRFDSQGQAKVSKKLSSYWGNLQEGAIALEALGQL